MAVVYIEATKDGHASAAGETLVDDAEHLLVMEPRVGYPTDPTWLSYIDCPLGSIPVGVSITSAILYLTRTTPDDLEDVFVDYATEDWVEGGTAPTRSGATGFPIYWDEVTPPYVILTPTVQAWYAGAIANYGCVLYPANPWKQALPFDFQPHEASYPPIWRIEYETGADVTDPVVAVTSPADAETVNGSVTIIGTASDDVAVTIARCYIDGQALDDVLTEPNYYGAWRWVWDTTGFVNGDHTIEIRAWDAAGNYGSDTITVTLSNSSASLTRYLFTDPMPIAEGRIADLAIETMDADDPPADPAQTYNVDLFCHVPGDSVDLDEYQPLELHRSHGFAVQGDTVRWALRARPLSVLAYYELTGGTEAIAMCEYTNDRVAILTDLPNVDTFDGTEITALVDLTVWGVDTPTAIAYVDGKLLIGMGNQLIVHDLDSGQEAFAIDLPGVTVIKAIEPRGTTQAWVAGDTVAGGRLFSFSYPSVTQIGNTEAILCLEAYGSSVAIGCVGGKVYATSGAAPALAYATGQANTYALHYVTASSMMLAGTSANGRIYRSAPAWALDGDLTLTTVRAIAQFEGKAYAGGNSGILWRRDSADTWAQDRTLPVVSNIFCMLAYTDPTGADCLLIGTDGAPARVYRLELSNAGQFQCGVDPPDVCFKILRSVEA